MSQYTIFGQSITLSDPAERFFDIQKSAWGACSNVITDFEKWYKSCGDIKTVINGYNSTAAQLVLNYAAKPLYDSLAKEYEIYDISRDSYLDYCFNSEGTDNAFNAIVKQYNEIISEQEEAVAYRQARKENRGRWQGGGFGAGGAIKGAATAGAFNMVTGFGHGIVNAFGNAGSAVVAHNAKQKLYNNPSTWKALAEGIVETVAEMYDAHIDLINEAKDEKYIESTFDEDKADTLFQNAKKLPDKSVELLVRSFTLCPWSEDLLDYIFINYPQERSNVWGISQRFGIALTDVVEDAIAREYTDEAKHSEKLALESKQRILSIMQDYNVKSSATLDALEHDCIERLCTGYENANKASCLSMIAQIMDYDAQGTIKRPFLDSIQERIYDVDREHLENICQVCNNAGKQECLAQIEVVKAYDTTDEIRSQYLEKLNQRLTVADMEQLEQLCTGYQSATKAQCLTMLDSVKGSDAFDQNKKAMLDRLEQRISAIEQEQLKQLCRGYERADKARCLSLIAKVETFDCSANNKNAMLSKLRARLEAADLEQLNRLCHGYESADKVRCLELIKSVTAYDALDRNKTVWVNKLTDRIEGLDTDALTQMCNGYEDADESTCQALMEAIQSYDTSQKIKGTFLTRLEQRIKTIWASEDGIIFDNIFLKTNIEDPTAVEKAIAYIGQQQDRTGIAQKYIDTLKKCNKKSIQYARIYRSPWIRSVFTGLWVSLVISAIFSQFVFHLGFIVSVLLFVIGIVTLCLSSKCGREWEKLTFGNTIFHPSLTKGKSVTGKEPSKILFIALFTVVLLAVLFLISQ